MLYLKGMAMGAADTVPGVSGGTIAFITNIYEELIFSIQACNVNALKILYANGPKAGWQAINGNFLLTLFAGIISSAILFANFVSYLLDNYEAHVMSFFIGLILASSLYIKKQITHWNFQRTLVFFAGILLAVLLNFIPQNETQVNLLFIFFSGAIAICAMILPGISGAFILLLLGAYEHVLNAVRNIDLLILLPFIAGCVIGLIGFSKLLAYLLKHWRDQTLIFLLGVLIGSLYSMWPEELNTDSFSFSFFIVFILLVLLGFLLVYFLEKQAQPIE